MTARNSRTFRTNELGEFRCTFDFRRALKLLVYAGRDVVAIPMETLFDPSTDSNPYSLNRRTDMIRRRYTRMLASLLVLAVLALAPAQAAAGERLIVRTSGLLDLPVVKSLCKLVGCDVLYGLDGTLGKLVLVTIPDGLSVPLVINVLETLPGVSVEVDQIVHTQQNNATATQAPLALYDKEPVSYYGTTVRGGYVRQPAVDILQILDGQRSYGVTGQNVTVAIIDTGVDAHPALKSVLLPGYDFTRNREGGSERSDVNQSTMAILDGQPGIREPVDDGDPRPVDDGDPGRTGLRRVRPRHDGGGRRSPDRTARAHPAAEGVQGGRIWLRVRRAPRHLHGRQPERRCAQHELQLHDPFA